MLIFPVSFGHTIVLICGITMFASTIINCDEADDIADRSSSESSKESNSAEITSGDMEKTSALERPNLTPKRLISKQANGQPIAMNNPDGQAMNWTLLHQKICSLTEEQTKTKSQLLEDCNKINQFYQIEQLFKPCRLAKASFNITHYLDYARSECKFEDCHQKVTNSPEYSKIMAEIERMSNEERIEKTMERYKCISTVLGIVN